MRQERIRELCGYLISMATMKDAIAAKKFADELEGLLSGFERELAEARALLNQQTFLCRDCKKTFTTEAATGGCIASKTITGRRN